MVVGMHASSQKRVYADLPTLTSLNYAKPGESFVFNCPYDSVT